MQMLHKKRIELALDIWSAILKGYINTRDEAVEFLRILYEREHLEPIRGKTKINIYDKEMATVYLVGKHGLGLDREIETYRNIVHIEIRAENVIEKILNGEDAKNALSKEFGEINENTIFRVLRLAMTAVLLEFMTEDTFIKIIDSFEKSFPEYHKKIMGFKRFYIAFKLAEEITIGKIRNRIEKEALKHALCLKLGAIKVAPPDSLIREIATGVLNAPEFKVNDALKQKSIEAKI